VDKVTEREALRFFIAVVVAALGFAWAVIYTVYDYDGGKKYTIVTEHGTYHSDNIRVCGKGIAFDTEDKKIIVMGNFNITSNLDK
jgi:hypothetical protein